MSQYEITPWKSIQDLLTVRAQLYRLDEATADKRRYAVGRVLMWHDRGHLPHAVESTALLVNAFLDHDVLGDSSAHSIRVLYSSAFARFVTGFCDIGRNRERSLEPSSMLDIARQIGMPEGFVALRHEATHEELPSLERLVPACEDALQWLWQVYWSRLDDRDERIRQRSKTTIEDCLANTRKAFRDYRSTRRKSLKNDDFFDDQAHLTVQRVMDTCGGDVELVQAVTDNLVETDLLIPTERALALGASIEGALVFWNDLLSYLSSQERKFCHCLVTSMLCTLDSRQKQNTQKEAYAFWIKHMLCSSEWLGKDRAGARLDAVRWSVVHPSDWSRSIAEDILADSDESFQDEWTELVRASMLQDGDAIRSSPELVSHDLDVGMNQTGSTDSPLGFYRAVLPPTMPIGMLEPRPTPHV